MAFKQPADNIDMERHPRVLVVDDDEPVRHMVAMAFRFDGFDVGEAGDGVQAIAQVEMFNPDVVVLDIMMPRMDGLSTLGHLRQQPGTTDLPVVLLSAKAAPTDIAIGMRAGANDYVTKPFVTDDLLERARKVMDTPASTSRARIAAATDSRSGEPAPVRRTMPTQARPTAPPVRSPAPPPVRSAAPPPLRSAAPPPILTPPRPAPRAPVDPETVVERPAAKLDPPGSASVAEPAPAASPAPAPGPTTRPATPPRSAPARATVAPTTPDAPFVPVPSTMPAVDRSTEPMPDSRAPEHAAAGRQPPGRRFDTALRVLLALSLVIGVELIVVLALLIGRLAR